MAKPKYIFVVYSENAIHGTFKTAREAHDFAQTHNLENENWRSIDMKWWATKQLVDEPYTN